MLRRGQDARFIRNQKDRRVNVREQHIVLFGDNATALSVASCLREHHITVVGTVSEPRQASLSRFVKGSIRVTEDHVWQVFDRVSLLRRTAEERLLLFPCSDAWIERLAANMTRTLQFGEMLPATAEHLLLTTDKSSFAAAIERLDLPRPRILNPHVDADWIPTSYPFVLKPSSTYRLEAQIGVKAVLIRCAEDWRATDKSLLRENSFLAQQYLAGASVSVCFCTAPGGGLAVSYATEKVHAAEMRTGSRVVTVERPDAIELAAEFVRRTGFVGFGELEMIDTDGGPVLLELNARPWSQVLMADTIGAPILESAISLMSGELPKQVAMPSKTPVEWISWDKDLLFRRALRRKGEQVRSALASKDVALDSKHVYAQSFVRDPLPALMHALTLSPLRPGRFLSRG